MASYWHQQTRQNRSIFAHFSLTFHYSVVHSQLSIIAITSHFRAHKEETRSGNRSVFDVSNSDSKYIPGRVSVCAQYSQFDLFHALDISFDLIKTMVIELQVLQIT